VQVAQSWLICRWPFFCSLSSVSWRQQCIIVLNAYSLIIIAG
jgi:hypothetical protein